jgi:hypothetical protein
MIKIIDGKRYNCDTATELEHYCNGLSKTDFNYLSETLYVTKKGNYFLYGSGGPKTKYSKSCGTASCGSRDIIPLTKKEAFEWCCDFCTAEQTEKLFPDMIDDA